MFGIDLNSIFIIIIVFETILISFLVFTVYFKLNKIYKKNTEIKHEFNEKIEKIGLRLNKYIFTPPPPIDAAASVTTEVKSKPETSSSIEDTVTKGNNTSLSSLNSGFSQTNLEEKITEIKTEILQEISRFKSAQEETSHNNTDYKNKKSEKSMTDNSLYNISYISSIKYDDDKRHYNPMNVIADIPTSLPSPLQTLPSSSPSIDTSVLTSINGNSLKTPAVMNSKEEKINSLNILENKQQQQQQPSFNNNSQKFNDIISPPPANIESENKQIPSVEGKSELKDNLEVGKEYANEQENENNLNKIVGNSSPELQKIEEEILTALKRLGEVKNNFSSDDSS